MKISESKKIHFDGIDFLKGFLMILVIIGHVQVKRLDQDLVRYAIYSFHMPLYLALSGFLLRKKSYNKLSFSKLIKKYFYRMIIPWLLVWIILFIYKAKNQILSTSGNIEFIRTTLKLMGHYILYPPYHLWYIYSLFLMLIILWIFEKIKFPARILLVGSFIFSMFWLCKYALNINVIPVVDPKAAPPYILGNKKTFYYFCYFYLGYFIRNYCSLKISKNRNLMAIVVFSFVRILDFYHINNTYFTEMIYILLNVSLITYCLNYISKIEMKNNRIVSKLKSIGKMSLPIYLWHDIVVLILKNLIFEKVNLYIYYGITSSIIFFGFIPLVMLLSKNKFINGYIFGARKINV